MAKKIGKMSGLQFALSQILEEPQQADEFSAEDAFLEARQKDPKITLPSVRNKIIRMERDGLLTKRQIRRNGTIINLYSQA